MRTSMRASMETQMKTPMKLQIKNSMENKMGNRTQNRRGFTLVEVMVVLAVLCILAAILVPTMLGFVNEARGKANLQEARLIYTAAQAAITEQYTVDPNFAISSAKLHDKDGNACGRVSDNALSNVQNGRSMESAGDQAIALRVLKYLNSENKAKADYKFKYNTNPQGLTVEDYEKNYQQPGVIIAYTKKGKVQFVEFGKDGYLIHYEDGKAEITKNGTFSIYPK